MTHIDYSDFFESQEYVASEILRNPDALNAGDIIVIKGNLLGVQGVRRSLDDTKVDLVDVKGDNKVVSSKDLDSVSVVHIGDKKNPIAGKQTNISAIDKIPSEDTSDILEKEKLPLALSNLGLKRSIIKLTEEEDSPEGSNDIVRKANQLSGVASKIYKIKEKMLENSSNRVNMASYKVNTV